MLPWRFTLWPAITWFACSIEVSEMLQERGAGGGDLDKRRLQASHDIYCMCTVSFSSHLSSRLYFFAFAKSFHLPPFHHLFQRRGEERVIASVMVGEDARVMFDPVRAIVIARLVAR